ncbi:DMT family transporter [Tissierella sp. Yu-01]|uniref:DMT family transporter n=1 Tax=Tissierella sp. Yu-01 TaxID=3035694 RepID=UPI00240E03A2|nr:DMT family transporter [Tissierella sp. Yu-01]WFA10052.1 DMT family transporter [Tissierella sp. Yu-01]
MKLLNIEEHKKAPIYVILAAICWGLIGVFSRTLSDGGFSSIQITTSRCVVTAVAMTIYLFVKDRNKLKIDIKDIWYFLGTGIGSIVFFNICFFLTIQETTLSVASILLYTAPYFVVILSAIFFKEKITFQKIVALLVAFLGCVLVTEIIGGQTVKLTGIGLLTGIGSGLGYALYSIFGSIALKKYHTMTVTAYTFIVASLGILPFSYLGDMSNIFINNNVVRLNVFLIGIVSTLIAFLLYTKGLQNMEAGKASVIAFVEPMVATIAGIVIFNEKLNLQNILGIALIFISIVLLNIKMGNKYKCSD